MRFGKYFIIILTLLLAVLGLFAEKLPKDDTMAVCVVSPSGEVETITPWVNDMGDAYFFLPGFTDLSTAQFCIGRDGNYLLDGRSVENSTSCDQITLNREYVLTCASGEEVFAETLTFVCSGGVDTVFLDLQSGTTDTIFRDKENKELSDLRAYSAAGELTLNASEVWVSGRGNSTWEEEKKPLNLEFSADTDFLGMEPAQKWVLLANAKEPSNLKNKLVMDFAARNGMPYSPDSRFVDLYLNGEYAGLYLLCERNEVHPNRVDISGTGSFLVCKDGQWRFQAANKPYFMTREGVALRIHYAEAEEQALLSHWQSAENAILAEDGMDPVSGKHWTELIDLESWVKKYLIEETFGNIDAMAYSQFFYYDAAEENPKIHAGPVWDYDLCLMKASEEGSCQLYLNKPDMPGSPWYPALYQKELFYDTLTDYYESWMRPALQKILDEGLEACAMQIDMACKMNDIRWALDSANATDIVRTNLEKRMACLDRLWLEGAETHLVTMRGFEYSVECYAVETGGRIPTVPVYIVQQPVRFLGWYYQDTDEPADLERPVTEDITIYLKYEFLEAQPEEEYEEPMTLLRIMPLLLMLVMFAIISGVGIGQMRKEKRNREGIKRNEIPS